MPIVQLHQREHRSILADLERRALVRLAMWLPVGVSSDHLTLLGLVSMIATGAAVAALAANWFGDSLDGTVARARAQPAAAAIRFLRRPRDRSGRHGVPARRSCLFRPDEPACGA